MIIYLFLISLCALSANSQATSLLNKLATGYKCSFDSMSSSFNATNMNAKINGTLGPFTLLALCDDLGIASFTAAQLNYQLIQGVWGFNELKTALPADGLLTTEDNGKKVRITQYGGWFFVNGQFRLGNVSREDYYPPAEVIKGAFYRLDRNIATDQWGLPTPPKASTIMTELGSKTPLVNYDAASQFVAVLLASAFVPPTGAWTIFLPRNEAFAKLPKYQQDALLNSGTTTAVDFIKNHVVTGAKFGAPLRRISKDLKPVADTFDTLTSLSGKTYTFSYEWQGEIYYIESSNQITLSDQHYLDGVVHVCSEFLYIDEIIKALPLPTTSEFITQYSTFDYPLIKSLGFDSLAPETAVGSFVALVNSLGVTIPDEPITMFFISDDSLAILDTSKISADLISYLIIPGQYDTLDSLPKDTLIPTSYTSGPSDMRINLYDDGTTQTYLINGLAKIISGPITLNKATIYIIYTETFISPACPTTTLTCEGPWTDTTVLASIEKNTDYAIFWSLLSKSTVKDNFVAPYTLLVFPDDIYSIATEGMVAYLLGNTTALDEYINKCYIPGTIYPNVAINKDVTVEAGDKSTYQFSRASDTAIRIVTDKEISGLGYVRNDGIYYELDGEVFTTYVPPVEVPVGPTPTGPMPDPKEPQGSSALRLVCVWSLFFVLAALYLM